MNRKNPNNEFQPSLFDLLPEAEAAAFEPEQVIETPPTPEEAAKRDFFRQKWLKKGKTGPEPVEPQTKPEIHYATPKIGETTHQGRVTPLPEFSSETQGVRVRRDAFYNDALQPLLETIPSLDRHFWAYSIMQDERDHQDKYKNVDHHAPAGPKEQYLRSQRNKFVSEHESKNGKRPSAESVNAFVKIREDRLRQEDHAYTNAKVEYEWHAKDYFKKYYDILLQNLPLHEVRKHDDKADIIDYIYAIYEGADFKRVFEDTVAGEYLDITSNGSGKKPTAKFVDKIKHDKKLSKLGLAEKREARKQMAKNAAMQRETLLEEKQVYDKRDQIKVGEAQPAMMQHAASILVKLAGEVKQSVVSESHAANSLEGRAQKLGQYAREQMEAKRAAQPLVRPMNLKKNNASWSARSNRGNSFKRSQPAKKEAIVAGQVIRTGGPQVEGQTEINDADLINVA